MVYHFSKLLRNPNKVFWTGGRFRPRLPSSPVSFLWPVTSIPSHPTPSTSVSPWGPDRLFPSSKQVSPVYGSRPRSWLMCPFVLQPFHPESYSNYPMFSEWTFNLTPRLRFLYFLSIWRRRSPLLPFTSPLIPYPRHTHYTRLRPFPYGDWIWDPRFQYSPG